ncbi:putative Phosphate regulon transcriptional regulatory protein PhoB [Nitrospira defluvii]|jgi:two-component system response regulator RegX3|uniref:Phosphate regulon transcriptional regulatory protein PhoB n=1 Tax=Nitrospira defluvii TaxID=330214 RepID=D8PFW0_9BACT|nr:putative Phosphate regulon transcriptional regulatory protein PhoB [Nitrospira defluvii]
MTDRTRSILLVAVASAAEHALAPVLKTNGYTLTVTSTLAQALAEIRRAPPALILLDRTWIATAALQRTELPVTIPIIVVQPFDQSCGPDECLTELDAGFDLMFCSPHYRELLAHIRAILRRHNMTSAPPSILRVEGLVMDIARHEVTVGGALVELTPKEFRILHQFLLSPGVVLSRQDLLNRVWGEDYALEEHALDVHIHSLRQKIEADSSKPSFIVTIRGIGYKLQNP